jgi:hypothetical protein
MPDHTKIIIILISCLLANIFLVSSVSAAVYNFQNAGDFQNLECIYNLSRPGWGANGIGTCSWIENGNGGNSYAFLESYITSVWGGYLGVHTSFQNKAGAPMSYWAGTILNSYGTTGGANFIDLNDASNNTMWYYVISDQTVESVRYEVIMRNNIAYVYKNGALVANSQGLQYNPSYVKVTAYGDGQSGEYRITTWDDIIYGSDTVLVTDVYGVPENGKYVLIKNITDPSKYGLYNISNGALISSTNMTTTYSFGQPNTSRTISLQNLFTGIIVSNYTVPAGTLTGTISWPLYDALFNNPYAGYGYYVTTIAGSTVKSDPIPYVGTEATCKWSLKQYTTSDTGVITWDMTGVYAPSLYTYKIAIAGSSNNIISNTTVTSTTGSISKTFDSDTYPQGPYYAELIATPLTGGSEILVAADNTYISSYVAFSGYVLNAENVTGIAGATVNITQSTGLTTIKTTDANGYWNSTDPWLVGSRIDINASKENYVTALSNFTPINARTLSYNISLIPINAVCNGVCLNGIVHESIYYTPISGASVNIRNVTTGFSNTTTTNAAGYYRFDNLINNQWYLITGSASGYNSQMVQAQMHGS